jgi:UDP-N-acetylmuramoyl-L-alanine---L-glutamate ligase
MGVEPVVVDDQPSATTFGGLPVIDSRKEGIDALFGCDVVVKSPGVSRYRHEAEELVTRGVALAGGLGLWMQEADLARVVCVTGTKGKSTTTALAGHLLSRFGYRCLVAGNIGRPPWDPEAGDDWDYWFIETSSYQATDLGSSPGVVAVTSLAPDHLDWHGDVEHYYRDKLSACARPGARLTVADASSDELRSHESLLGPRVWWVAEGDPDLDGDWVDRLKLPGRHSRRNALIARACLVALGVEEAGRIDAMVHAAEGFSALEHRLFPLGSVAGVEFVDDSLSTNVLPTLAALEALGTRPVALLAGGHDRGIDYMPLGRSLAARAARTLVVTLPACGPRIHAAIDDAVHEAVTSRGERAAPLEVRDAKDIAEATRDAFEWARPLGGVVLLSPAAPSFGQFRDYQERSAAFGAAMHACGEVTDAPA